MKKMVYKLEYKDFVGRSCVREYKATCIIEVIDEAKNLCGLTMCGLLRLLLQTERSIMCRKCGDSAGVFTSTVFYDTIYL